MQLHTEHHTLYMQARVCMLTFPYATVTWGMQAQKAGNDGESQLQLQAFEAINEMVRNASGDTLPTVQHILPVMLNRLGATLAASSASALPQERQSDLQVPLPAGLMISPSRSSAGPGVLVVERRVLMGVFSPAGRQHCLWS